MYGVIIGGISALTIGLIFFLGPASAAFLVVTAAGVTMMALRPSWSIYAAMIVGLTAFPAFIPYSVQLGPTTVFLFEPFLMFAALWSVLTHPHRVVARARIVWLATLIAAAAIAGLAQQFPTIEVISDGRGLLSTLLAAIVASRIYGTPHAQNALKVLKISLWTSLAVTLAASVLKFPIAGRTEAAALFLSSSGAGSSDSTRFLTSASQLAVLVTCIAIALVIASKASPKQVAPYLVPALVLAFLSFSRNSFLAVIVAMAFAILAARTLRPVAVMAKIALFVGVPVTILALAHVAIGLPGGDYVATQVQAFSTRVLGGLDTSTLADDTSAVARTNEDGYMMAAIAESPAVGHGLGYAYRPPVGPTGSFSATKGQYYGHNFYLWITVKAGLAGLLVFLYFTLAPTLIAFRRATSACIGLGAATAGLLVALVFAPFPNDVGNGGSLSVGLLFGALMTAGATRPKSGADGAGALESASDKPQFVRQVH